MNTKGYPLIRAFKELGLSRTTAYRWAKLGRIEVSRLPSGRFRISDEEVQRLKELLSGKQSNA